MTLRLILGDQLNHNHSWFSEENNQVLYVMAEMKQETDYVKHHIQKVVAFFRSMRNFAKWLTDEGHEVVYFNLDSKDNSQDLSKIIKALIEEHSIETFEYQLPDEYRLDQQLKNLCESLSINTKSYDTEHFYTNREDLTNFFEGKKQSTMEYFYRDMRKKHDILMVNDKDPEGGKWNYDQSNRKKWKGEPSVPAMPKFNNKIEDIQKMIEEVGVATIGSIDTDNFQWPVSREQSLELLDHFCQHLLLHFGDYQDAMDPDENFLFHSRLSFAMNAKMLSPQEVVDKTIDHWRSNKEEIDISQVEGFVRQILGWREYMRGMYWREMPEYESLNELDNHNDLPEFFWTGKTKMNCLKNAINQSLEHAYAHHIQRLMITGNYALLTMVDPSQVDDWYLGIYIDAIQWVEITNTRGMSQYADGGKIATKPYVSSGSYINKMSNYCSDCHYKISKKHEEDACPFNSLYWNFLDEKQEHFKNNQRMGMMMNMLEKMDKEKLKKLKERANKIISNPDEF